jgi:subtilase-type serine protease
MSTTNISSGTTAPITINNNDTLNVLNGGSIVTATAVTWKGGSSPSSLATINNSGTISGTTRGIDATGSSFTGTGSLTVNNVSGASITAVNDAIRINGDVTSGTITVVNGGVIQSTGSSGSGGQALDFDAISSTNAHVFITNQATASSVRPTPTRSARAPMPPSSISARSSPARR